MVDMMRAAMASTLLRQLGKCCKAWRQVLTWQSLLTMVLTDYRATVQAARSYVDDDNAAITDTPL